MSKLNFFVFLLLISLVGTIFAQSGEDGKARINQVKRDNKNYIFGDQTAATEEEALQLAMAELQENLNIYTEDMTQGTVEVVVELIKEVATITITRGDQYRAFVYVKKPETKEAEKNTTNEKNPGKKAPTQTKGQTPPSPSPTEVATPEPTPKPTTEQPIVTTSPAETTPVTGTKHTASQVIAEITKFSTIKELGEYLPAQYKNGAVSHYNEYSQLLQPEAYYLVACDKQTGRIVAVLSPGRDTRTNLKTRQKDKMENYRNCKIIGFQLAK